MSAKRIVFFDGFCILCNGFVDLLIRLDKNGILFFSTLQGVTAKNILEAELLKKTDTVIFRDTDQKIYIKSSAVLKTLYIMGGLWKFFAIFYLIPLPVRDAVYNWVANHRYGWFGKRDSCRLPSKAERKKILP